MTLSAFSDKSRAPTPAELKMVLGRSHPAWVKLVALIADRIDGVTPVWKLTSASTGWGMRLMDGKRVIVYMTPQRGQFLVSFALGERAVAAAGEAKLPAALRDAIDAAPRYAEGRGVRIEVRNTALVASLARLAEIKRDH